MAARRVRRRPAAVRYQGRSALRSVAYRLQSRCRVGPLRRTRGRRSGLHKSSAASSCARQRSRNKSRANRQHRAAEKGVSLFSAGSFVGCFSRHRFLVFAPPSFLSFFRECASRHEHKAATDRDRNENSDGVLNVRACAWALRSVLFLLPPLCFY